MTFLDLLVTRNIPYRPRNKAGEIWICCPRPDCHDTRFRFGLNWMRGWGHCFNCDWKSRHAISAILRWWRLEVHVDLPAGQEEPSTKKLADIQLPEDFMLVSSIDPKDGEPFITPWRYFQNRGFTLQQARRHRIGASFSGRYAHRLVMPIIWRKRIKGLVARTWVKGQEPRYLNSQGERLLWNMEDCYPKGQRLLLLEGIFKALSVESLTDSRCAALLGHSVTERQNQQIERCGFRRIDVWPDPDPQGLEGALQIALQLSEAGHKVRMPSRIPEAQADDLTAEQRVEVLDSMEPLDYSLRMHYKLEVPKR